jgi:hypothetical protein
MASPSIKTYKSELHLRDLVVIVGVEQCECTPPEAEDQTNDAINGWSQFPIDVAAGSGSSYFGDDGGGEKLSF